MQHLFNTVKPQYICQVKIDELFPYNNIPEDIRQEVTFFNSTPSFVRNHEENAPLTKKLLKRYFRDMFSDDDYHH